MQFSFCEKKWVWLIIQFLFHLLKQTKHNILISFLIIINLQKVSLTQNLNFKSSELIKKKIYSFKFLNLH